MRFVSGVARDLLEARAAMEVAIAEYAAERADDEDLAAIRECLVRPRGR